MQRLLQITTVAAILVSGLHAADVDYVRDVKPLLAEKCISCHGPVKQEAGLRLDAAQMIQRGSESGPVANATAADRSLILQRVLADDDERMPPPDEGERLTPEQVAKLREWISRGMPAPADEAVLGTAADHWAFQPVRRPPLPTGSSGNPIDQLIASTQERVGLKPFPPADALTLLRRVSLDVVGLPPGEEEVRRLLAEPPAGWYEELVDRLLASPQYGERWGRHWMDVWRYSDWDGYKQELRGSQRHIWRWRDWIIESLNEDKPYDRMIVEMLAGDELAPQDPHVLRATGFLARNFHGSNRDIWLDATVEHTIKAFLGLTVNCARCHDHKYDPIDQSEYYAIRAVFEPHRVRTERLPGQPDVMRDGLVRAYDADLDVQTFVYVRGNEKQPDKEHPIAPSALELLGTPLEVQPVPLPLAATAPFLAEHIEREDLAAAEAAYLTAQQEFEKISREAHARREPASVSGAGGDPSRPPSPSLPRDLSDAEQQAHLKLAAEHSRLESLRLRWIADRAKHEHPETDREQLSRLAREAAAAERRHNLLAARRDLLSKRLELEQAEQLDDVTKRNAAVEKAVKELEPVEKQYQQAAVAVQQSDGKYTPVGKSYPTTSSGRRLALAHWIARPDNPLTARVAVNHLWLRHFGEPLVPTVFDFGLQAPRPVQAELLDWLAAELIDSGWSMKHLHRLILTSAAYQRASSGETSLAAHNSKLDPENVYLWRSNIGRLDAEIVRDSLLAVAGKLDTTLGGPDIDFTEGETVLRRSVYFRHAYEKQMQMLVLFDAASPTECYRRSDSITPQQALVLSNSGLSRTLSRQLARELTAKHASDEEFIDAAFLRVLGRPVRADERTACVSHLERQAMLLKDSSNLTQFTSESKAGTAAADDPRVRAREGLIHVLMNHNDFVTVR